MSDATCTMLADHVGTCSLFDPALADSGLCGAPLPMCAAGCGHAQDEHGAWGCCHIEAGVQCGCPRTMGEECDHAEWMRRMLANDRVRQATAAWVYYWILKEHEFGIAVDWAAVNLAVIARWPRGLNRVKRRAHKGLPP